MPAPDKMIIARIDPSDSLKSRAVRIIFSDHPAHSEGALETMETMWYTASEGYKVVILPPESAV